MRGSEDGDQCADRRRQHNSTTDAGTIGNSVLTRIHRRSNCTFGSSPASGVASPRTISCCVRLDTAPPLPGRPCRHAHLLTPDLTIRSQAAGTALSRSRPDGLIGPRPAAQSACQSGPQDRRHATGSLQPNPPPGGFFERCCAISRLLPPGSAGAAAAEYQMARNDIFPP